MDIDIPNRLNLAFEMWERAHGRPLDDDTVASWLTAAGYELSPHYVAQVRQGEITTLPEPARAGLAQVFGLDPGYFGFDPGPDQTADAEVIAHLDNSALRRLGQAVDGVSLRTLLYLESVADVLRQADGLPPREQTAQL